MIVTIGTQVAIAWLYGHVFEYCAHRYLLHDHKNFKPLFRNHFGHHHYVSRKNEMYDEGYSSFLSSRFEMIALVAAAFVHLPIAFYYSYAYCTLLVSLTVYYIVHRKAHTNVEWGRRWLPWHYDHHMGKNQHLNWGVRLPIIDILTGTRKVENKFLESNNGRNI